MRFHFWTNSDKSVVRKDWERCEVYQERLTGISDAFWINYLPLPNKPLQNVRLNKNTVLFFHDSEGQQFGLVSTECFFCWSHLSHPRGCCLHVVWLSCWLTLLLWLWLGFPLQGHHLKEASLASSRHDLRFQEGNGGSCKVSCDPSLEVP